jgi:hypothetical protein
VRSAAGGRYAADAGGGRGRCWRCCCLWFCRATGYQRRLWICSATRRRVGWLFFRSDRCSRLPCARALFWWFCIWSARRRLSCSRALCRRLSFRSTRRRLPCARALFWWFRIRSTRRRRLASQFWRVFRSTRLARRSSICGRSSLARCEGNRKRFGCLLYLLSFGGLFCCAAYPFD